MSLKIHAFPMSPRSFKVLATANHLGLDYELCVCDLTKGAQKTEAFTAINPNQKAPALEDGDFKLWESNAIVQYLAALKPEGALLPKDERGRAEVASWQFWESTTWDPPCANLIFERFLKVAFKLGEPDQAEIEKALVKFNAAARILNAQLKGRKFVCGDRITIADFTLGAVLILAESAQLPISEYPEMKRWSEALAALPAWQSTLAMSAAPSQAA